MSAIEQLLQEQRQPGYVDNGSRRRFLRVRSLLKFLQVREPVTVRVFSGVGGVQRTKMISTLEAVRHTVIVVVGIGIVPNPVAIIVSVLTWVQRQSIIPIQKSIVIVVRAGIISDSVAVGVYGFVGVIGKASTLLGIPSLSEPTANTLIALSLCPAAYTCPPSGEAVTDSAIPRPSTPPTPTLTTWAKQSARGGISNKLD